MSERTTARNGLSAPMAIYEMHVGSWRRNEDGTPMSYRDLAVHLVEYLVDTNFTHVEFMPIVEHPFGGSWGYQSTGFYAPTSRFGTPDDVMYLIDQLHQAGIGVILDWVPSHFPTDEHGLMFFDGTHLYEHADPRQGIHPDWDSAIFNYGREQVRSFLLSNAMFWLDRYHVDGLRVDAVASMLYLDYSREPGEWIPNQYGGHENIEAIEFLRRFNSEVYSAFPDVQTIAEESTAWPMVSRPTYLGGLGFGLKWDMGWMHDTLRYMSKDPVHRPYHHTDLSFRGMYAFAENYCLPLSHDEVVHLKGSLLTKMPGDDWQRRANLRLLFSYMYTTPGKKLVFMGGEIGQWREWDHDGQLQWELLDDPAHRGIRHLVSELGRVYRDEPALHELDNDPAGWQWIDASDAVQSTLSYLRAGRSNDDVIAVVCNFTAIPRMNHRIGVPRAGFWREILNSDADAYGGSGHGNYGGVEATPVPFHGRPYSVVLTLPPLGAVILKSDGDQQL
ncbi:MAG: 1,4-alpha-glucan branching protein GlgB [Actinobacteria bacterium]|nr:1,4-alpha-glucan branching protein GlgB [Actinomycetota bacterium]